MISVDCAFRKYYYPEFYAGPLIPCTLILSIRDMWDLRSDNPFSEKGFLLKKRQTTNVLHVIIKNVHI